MSGLEALYTALYSYLLNAGGWGAIVYPDEVDIDATTPYLHYFVVAAGALNERVKIDDFEAVLTIKCVSPDSTVAMTGADEISALLDNHGAQDYGEGQLAMPPGSGWEVLTITKERRIQQVVRHDKSGALYESGNQYRFRMEAV